MTRQHQEFDYYCLDRLQPFENDLKITYSDGSVIKNLLFKVGLKAKIKHVDCFILYTDSDKDLEQFIYIDSATYFDNQRRFFNDVFSIQEVKEIIKCLKTINIFEFVSLLDFIHIYEDFREIVETNWNSLNMDNLIEI